MKFFDTVLFDWGVPCSIHFSSFLRPFISPLAHYILLYILFATPSLVRIRFLHWIILLCLFVQLLRGIQPDKCFVFFFYRRNFLGYAFKGDYHSIFCRPTLTSRVVINPLLFWLFIILFPWLFTLFTVFENPIAYFLNIQFLPISSLTIQFSRRLRVNVGDLSCSVLHCLLLRWLVGFIYPSHWTVLIFIFQLFSGQSVIFSRCTSFGDVIYVRKNRWFNIFLL